MAGNGIARGLRVRRLVLTAAAGLVALAATGCGDSKKSGDKDEAPPAPQLTDHTLERDVRITISGARTADFHQRVKVRFLFQQGMAGEQNVSVYSVTIPELAAVNEMTRLLPDIAVFADYKGDGTYRVLPGAGTPEPRTGPTAPKRELDPRNQDNHVIITFLTSGPTPSEVKFGYALEPCTIEVREKTTAGSAICPKLVSLDGEQIVFKMSWDK